MTPSGRGPVLLCYDGSEPARRAIAWTGTLLPGSEAVVLHLWDSPALAGAFAPEAGAGADMHRRALELAAEGCELARAAGLSARPLAAGIGGTWQSILSVADAEDARLVVTGARGLSGVRSALGSVSSGVLQHARRPVLVVPPAPHEEATTASLLLRTISGLTGSHREDALARYVIQEAGRGRDLADILGDAYVENRADRRAIGALLDRRDVVEALGEDAVEGLKSRIATLG
jgi:nucleotide-binding universal stress UspA family protein